MSSANLHLPQSDCAISLCEKGIASVMSRTSLLVKTVAIEQAFCTHRVD